MPAERIAMRQVRDVLRLKAAGIIREIARRVGVAPSTVRLTIEAAHRRRAELAVAGGDDRRRAGGAALHRGRHQAGPPPPRRAGLGGGSPRAEAQARDAADPVGRVHRAASRRLSLFAVLRAVSWLGVRISVTMRQSHAGGDKLFVDYAGDTVPVIIDRLTGEIRPAQIFVAVLGASSFTYAEATWTQALADWIGAHTRAFEAIGGVPNAAGAGQYQGGRDQGLPLRAAGQPHLYGDGGALRHGDPAGTAAAAARQGESRGGGADRRALATGRLRHRRFYSLAELNAAISELLRRLNEERPIRRLGVTRRQLLEELDRPRSRRCRIEPYVFAEWRLRRVGIDYHVEVEGHFYSVPYCFARGEVEVRLTPALSRYFSRASGSPPICAPAATAATPPCPRTCRQAIGAMPTGRSSASAGRLPRSGPPPRPYAS